MVDDDDLFDREAPPKSGAKTSGVACPYCGEPVDTSPDIGGGEHQQYVEDCSMCCRPLLITATYRDARNDFEIEVVGDL
jgi:hypothetical protein